MTEPSLTPMDTDDLAHTLGAGLARRAVLRAAAAGAVGSGALLAGTEAQAQEAGHPRGGVRIL